MQRPDELSVEEIRAYLAGRESPQRPAAHVQAYRDAAAVLVAVKAPDRLRPLGAAPENAAPDLLAPDLVPATGRKLDGQVMLAPDVRAETISDLVAMGRVEDALAANPQERSGALQAHFERYLRHEAPPLAAQTLDDLDATLQVAVWLAGVVDGVPTVGEVESQAAYLRLLAPFETLAGDAIFRGRRKELDQLRRYIGVISPESALERLRATAARWIEPERQPAVSVWGIGGAGKSSLVARFMLEHTRLPEEERIPFGYLDFARAELDIGDPLGLSRELLSQLNLQFPGFGLTYADYVTQYFGRDLSEFHFLSTMLSQFRRKLGPRPYVVVLDTFEEVQYRGEERARLFWDLLSEFQNRAPFLRVLVAGRAPVESLRLAGRPPRQIELGDLDEEAALAFLAARGIEDPEVRRGFIESFGRLPLSLKLASSLAARMPGGASELLGPTASGLTLLSASEEVVQAQLYGRILDHISDERIRRLAHPGLTLRRINPALILEVLNEPCGLGIAAIQEATALFEELRRESSLVSVDSADGDLVHRPDLRRVMLKMLLNGAPAVVEQIRHRAIAWYQPRDGRRNRAEEIYHRLHLGDRVDPRELANSEVRASIQTAIEEFPVETQLWLATTGFAVPEAVREQATRDQSHAAAAAQIEQLLPYGRSSEEQALQLFRSAYANLDEGRPVYRSLFGARTDRGSSPVFRVGARVFAQLGDDTQALSLIERGLERTAREGAAELTLGLLKERAWLYRHRPGAEQADGLALLGEHALRHQDLAGRIQHRAQSILATGRISGTDLAVLADLLSQAAPHDLWDLVPALQPAFNYGPDVGAEALIQSMRDLIAAGDSPFASAVFPDPARQSAVDELLGWQYEYDPGGDRVGRPFQERFTNAFLRLCEVWPYRILYVAPPFGRRGEQLTFA